MRNNGNKKEITLDLQQHWSSKGMNDKRFPNNSVRYIC